jgi:hypothetical protein
MRYIFKTIGLILILVATVIALELLEKKNFSSVSVEVQSERVLASLCPNVTYAAFGYSPGERGSNREEAHRNAVAAATKIADLSCESPFWNPCSPPAYCMPVGAGTVIPEAPTVVESSCSFIGLGGDVVCSAYVSVPCQQNCTIDFTYDPPVEDGPSGGSSGGF